MKHHNGLETGWLIRRDTPAVLNVDFECYPRPFSEEDLLEQLRVRNVVGYVGKISGDVVAYMLYSLEKHHINILRFAVHPNWQRQGIGRALVERLWDKLSSGRREHLDCVVSERNTDAHLFLKDMGFFAEKVERDYFKRGHDGYAFRYTLDVGNGVPKWVSKIPS